MNKGNNKTLIKVLLCTAVLVLVAGLLVIKTPSVRAKLLVSNMSDEEKIG